MRLIVTPAEASAVSAQQSSPLVNALAQAQLWREQLLRGEVASLRMLAKSAHLSERYVSRIMRCAFLAPDLVEAILQARQPPGLTLRKLVVQLPLDLSEQRRMFGSCTR